MGAKNGKRASRLLTTGLKPKLIARADLTNFVDHLAVLKKIGADLQAGKISSFQARALTGLVAAARETLKCYLTYIGEYQEKKQVDITVRDERIQQFAEMPDEQRKVTLEDYRKVENRLIQRMKEAGLEIARDN